MNLIRLISQHSQCFQEAVGEYVLISPYQSDVAKRLGPSFEAKIIAAAPVIINSMNGDVCYTYNSPAWKQIEAADRCIRRVELTLELPSGTRAVLHVPPRRFTSLFGKTEGTFVFKVAHLSTSKYNWYEPLILRPLCPVCKGRKKLSLFGRYRQCPLCNPRKK